MVKIETILRNYIYQLSINEDMNLEDYVRDIFGGISNSRLKNYCNKNCIQYKSNSDKEMMIQRIYGSLTTLWGFKILSTNRLENETIKEFYYRLYINF